MDTKIFYISVIKAKNILFFRANAFKYFTTPRWRGFVIRAKSALAKYKDILYLCYLSKKYPF